MTFLEHRIKLGQRTARLVDVASNVGNSDR